MNERTAFYSCLGRRGREHNFRKGQEVRRCNHGSFKGGGMKAVVKPLRGIFKETCELHSL
ncbi:hypothetical protein C0J52_03996 [Blattella germanica]|nr:hypothetical protein C0J52_03996 [Blattella germanica]